MCRDPKDDKILSLALSGKAEYIITGDQDLLILNLFQGVKIITIEEFLNLANWIMDICQYIKIANLV